MGPRYRQRAGCRSTSAIDGYGHQRHLESEVALGLVLLGVFVVLVIELMGIRSLTFAVGSYLSISTTLAIFVGGVIRWLSDRAVAKAGEGADDSETSPGSLFASGLIAAGGIVGLLGVIVTAIEQWQHVLVNPLNLHIPFLENNSYVSVLMFALLAFALFHFARKPLKK